MGGIGLSTVAHEVFKQAEGHFDVAIRLNVGGEARDVNYIMKLLDKAFQELFPDLQVPPFLPPCFVFRTCTFGHSEMLSNDEMYSS